MRTPHPFRHFFLLLILIAAPAVSAKIEWKTKEYRGRSYVPLAQVKDFYGMTSMSKSGSRITLKNSAITMEFRSGSQEVLMNKVKFIFSHAVVSLSGPYISVTDLNKVIDPVLRPYSIAGKKAFDTVIIDAGHGGRDAGAVNSIGTEAGYNLKVARLLRDNLQKMGFKVVMTRNSDRFLTLQQRVELANKYTNAVFISIHFNSAGSTGRSRARGIETFTLSPQGVAHYGRGIKESDFIARRGNAQDSANIALATAVHWCSIQYLGKKGFSVPDRGVRRARYSVLTGVKHPAILFEGGFMSHPQEKYLIHKPDYQETLAEAMAHAISFYRKATLDKVGKAKKR